MAFPSTHEVFKAYTLAKEIDPPKHTGKQTMFGPFVVTGLNRVNGKGGLAHSHSSNEAGLANGGLVVVGEGWTGGLASSALPTNFKWGVLMRVNNHLVLGSVSSAGGNMSFTRSNIAVDSSSDGTGTGIANLSTSLSGSEQIGFDSSHLENDNFCSSESIGSGAGTIPNRTLIFTKTDSKLHAYEITATSAGAVDIKHHYANIKTLLATRLRLYTGSGANAVFSDEVDGETGGTFTHEESDTGAPSSPGSSHSLNYYASGSRDGGNAALSGGNTSGDAYSVIYLEDIQYDESGKPYKSVSDSIPLKAAVEGGIDLHVRYWPNSPLYGPQPYESKRIRIITSKTANNAFWVG